MHVVSKLSSPQFTPLLVRNATREILSLKTNHQHTRAVKQIKNSNHFTLARKSQYLSKERNFAVSVQILLSNSFFLHLKWPPHSWVQTVPANPTKSKGIGVPTMYANAVYLQTGGKHWEIWEQTAKKGPQRNLQIPFGSCLSPRPFREPFSVLTQVWFGGAPRIKMRLAVRHDSHFLSLQCGSIACKFSVCWCAKRSEICGKSWSIGAFRSIFYTVGCNTNYIFAGI